MARLRLQKQISVPDAETWARVQARARAAEMSVSEYLLSRALAEDDELERARADLRRLSGELGVLMTAAGLAAGGKKSASDYLDEL